MGNVIRIRKSFGTHLFVRIHGYMCVPLYIVEELLFFLPFCDSNELIKSSIVTGDGLPVFVRYIHWIQWSLRARLLRYFFSLSKSSRLIFRSCLDAGNNKKTGRNSLEWKERLQGTRSKTQSKWRTSRPSVTEILRTWKTHTRTHKEDCCEVRTTALISRATFCDGNGE